MNKQTKFVAFVFAILLTGVCILVYRNTQAVQQSNQIEQQEHEDLLSGEYHRILLGCQTSGAIESTDVWLRELCDERLPEIRKELIVVSDESL
jgi:hypothetical protein